MSLISPAFRYGSGSNVIELFLDIVCPFSKRQFDAVFEDVFPSLPENVQFVFRCHVQPWHPASTLTHESVIAVALLKPEKTLQYIQKLYKESDKFYDSHTINEARSATYYRLSKIASAVGVNESQFLDLVSINAAKSATDLGSNGGNKVTDLLKKHIKYGRQNGIHVSPTVCLNGIVDNTVSSTFMKDDWSKWFKQNLSS